MNSSPLIYRIDPSHRITYVNDEWDRVVERKLLSGSVIGRVIWDYISDTSTESIYRDLIQSLTVGDPVEFPLRCDSPDRRTLLQMKVELLRGGEVQFTSVPVSSEPHQAEHKLKIPPGEVVHVCSWCKRIRWNDSWADLVPVLNDSCLFSFEKLPQLSHGICDSCHSAMSSRVKPGKRRTDGAD